MFNIYINIIYNLKFLYLFIIIKLFIFNYYYYIKF